MIMKDHVFVSSLLVLSFTALAACSGGGISGLPADSQEAPPSDRFFRSVFAGSAGDGSANVLVFDPSVEEARGSGSGSPPAGQRSVLIELFFAANPEPVTLTGRWSEGGAFTAAGSRPALDPVAPGTPFEISGTFESDSVSATVIERDETDPELSYESELRGFDIQRGEVAAFCGSYEGTSSGAWNFVVQDSGEIAGSYSRGPLSGSASGDGVTLSWSLAGGLFCEDGGNGVGSGTLSADGLTIQGPWSGNACGEPYSGTWQGSRCNSPTAEVAEPTTDGCACDSRVGTTGSFCCPAPGPCCYASAAEVDWN